MNKFFAILIVFLVNTIPGNPALAQTGFLTQSVPTAEITAPSPNDLKELSRLLSDPEILQWLKNSASQNANSRLGSSNTKTSLRAQIELSMVAIRLRLAQIETAGQMLPAAPGTIIQIWNSRIDGSETLRTIAFTVIFLFIGAGLEWLYWQYFVSTLKRVEFNTYDTLPSAPPKDEP